MIIGSVAERNNFTILRLVLAWLVFLGHFKLLQGITHPRFPFIYADFAVDAFFVVSGYLISLSWSTEPNLRYFYIRRLFRLYPLYLAVVALQTATLALASDAGPGEIVRYFAVNAVFLNFLQYDIGHVTHGLFVPGLNPSLWTLKIEVAFYLVVPFLWHFTQRFGAAFLAAIFIASAAWNWGFGHFGVATVAKQLPGQLQFFALGMALCHYRHRLPGRSWVWAACLPPLVLYASLFIRSPIVYPLVVAAIVWILALRSRPLGLHLDISYGVYLLHGPVIQSALLIGIFSNTPAWFGLSSCIILGLALLAEAAIERPFMALGRRLARGQRATPALSAANG